MSSENQDNEEIARSIRNSLQWSKVFEPITDVKPEWYDGITEPIKEVEVKQMILELPNNKAPGQNGIINEILKILMDSETNVKTITKLLHSYQISGQTPEQDQIGKIIVLPKETPWNESEDKLRPITLLDTIYKVCTAILTKRLTKVINEYQILKGANYGFHTGYSATDALALIRSAIETANITGQTLYMATLDIQKAYNKIPKEAMIESLKRIRVPNTFIGWIRALLTQRKLYIETPYGQTETFKSTRGLPQGGTISPILWSIFYNPLLIQLDQETRGYKIKNESITASAFADDLHPMSETAEDLQKQLNIISEYLRMMKMKMCASKCKILSTCKIPSLELVKLLFPGPDVRDGPFIMSLAKSQS